MTTSDTKRRIQKRKDVIEARAFHLAKFLPVTKDKKRAETRRRMAEVMAERQMRDDCS